MVLRGHPQEGGGRRVGHAGGGGPAVAVHGGRGRVGGGAAGGLARGGSARQFGVIYIRYAAAAARAGLLGQTAVDAQQPEMLLLLRGVVDPGVGGQGPPPSPPLLLPVSLAASPRVIMVGGGAGVTRRGDGLDPGLVAGASPVVAGDGGAVPRAIRHHGLPVGEGRRSVVAGAGHLAGGARAGAGKR